MFVNFGYGFQFTIATPIQNVQTKHKNYLRTDFNLVITLVHKSHKYLIVRIDMQVASAARAKYDNKIESAR